MTRNALGRNALVRSRDKSNVSAALRVTMVR